MIISFESSRNYIFYFKVKIIDNRLYFYNIAKKYLDKPIYAVFNIPKNQQKKILR
jgi:hypothetical protein